MSERVVNSWYSNDLLFTSLSNLEHQHEWNEWWCDDNTWNIVNEQWTIFYGLSQTNHWTVLCPV